MSSVEKRRGFQLCRSRLSPSLIDLDVPPSDVRLPIWNFLTRLLAGAPKLASAVEVAKRLRGVLRKEDNKEAFAQIFCFNEG